MDYNVPQHSSPTPSQLSHALPFSDSAHSFPGTFPPITTLPHLPFRATLLYSRGISFKPRECIVVQYFQSQRVGATHLHSVQTSKGESYLRFARATGFLPSADMFTRVTIEDVPHDGARLVRSKTCCYSPSLTSESLRISFDSRTTAFLLGVRLYERDSKEGNADGLSIPSKEKCLWRLQELVMTVVE
ncbi:hypothetical protein F5888DRAFT_1632131 [Russula emetica]|nr:hypothetical protein F5888DRAFT_1632131 [Russula emetica]